MERVRVLVVGDCRDRDALAELLALHDHQVAVSDRGHAVEAARAWHPHVIITDACVPDLDGRALVDALAALRPTPRVILISPRPSRALEALGVTCMTKPIELGALLGQLSSPGLAA